MCKIRGRLKDIQPALLFSPVMLPGGCFPTRMVTVLRRLLPASITIVPVAGNPASDAIDEAAETVAEVSL